MKWINRNNLAAVLSFAAATTFADVTVIFQNGLNGYSGTQDTFVMTGRPDQNTDFTNHPDGTRYQFEWDGTDADGRNLALIQFKDMIGLGENQIPPGAKIIKAELQTWVSNSGSSNQSSVIHNLLVEWDQTTATYNSVFPNQDINADPETGTYISETAVEVFHNPPNEGDTWRVDITALVQEISDGLPNNGFVIIPNFESSNGFGQYSSETPLATPETRLTVETTAGTYTFKDGVNGYEGVRDALIANSENRYFTNYGDDNSVNLRRSAVDNVELGLLRFDDVIGSGAGQIPPNSTVTSARLTLWVQNGNNSTVYVSDILPYSNNILGVAIDTNFDENTVTFENFVEDGVYPQVGVEIASVPAAEFRASAFTTIEVDVTTSVKKWVAGESPNYGWLLEPTSGTQISLSATEGGDGYGPPRLTITYEGETTVSDFMIF